MLGKWAAAGTKGWKANLSEMFPSCRNSLTHSQDQQSSRTWRSNLGTSQISPAYKYCQFNSISTNTQTRQTAHSVRLTSTSASRTQSEVLTPELYRSGMKPEQRESSPSLALNLLFAEQWDNQDKNFLGLTKTLQSPPFGL